MPPTASDYRVRILNAVNALYKSTLPKREKANSLKAVAFHIQQLAESLSADDDGKPNSSVKEQSKWQPHPSRRK